MKDIIHISNGEKNRFHHNYGGRAAAEFAGPGCWLQPTTEQSTRMEWKALLPRTMHGGYLTVGLCLGTREKERAEDEVADERSGGGITAHSKRRRRADQILPKAESFHVKKDTNFFHLSFPSDAPLSRSSPDSPLPKAHYLPPKSKRRHLIGPPPHADRS